MYRQIKRGFISLLRQSGQNNDFECQFWHGGNILEISGSMNCLVYLKVSSADPRWGVTANRTDELHDSGKKWFLVLLQRSPQTGYFFAVEDVERSLSIPKGESGYWYRSKDGDYKVGAADTLQFSQPFRSFSEFLNSLLSSCR